MAEDNTNILGDTEEASRDVLEVAQVTQSYYEHYESIFARMRQNNSAVYGDQWTLEESAEARVAQGRTDDQKYLSLNRILPLVMQLLGSALGRQTRWRAKPVDNRSDLQTADVINALLDHISVDNVYEYVKYLVRVSGVCAGMGWYYVPPPDEDLSEDKLVNICHYPSEFILLDPDARDILQSDWKRVVRLVWMPADEILDRWPEATEDIKKGLDSKGTEWTNLSDRLKVGVADQSMASSADGRDYGQSARTDLFVNQMNDLYRVCELWQRRRRRVQMLDGTFRSQIYMQLKVTLPYLNTRLGKAELPYRWYPFAVYQPINVGTALLDGRAYVDNLRDIQREKNRLRAIAADATQKSTNDSIIFPSGDEELAKAYKDNAGKAGFVGVKKTNLPIEKVNSSGISPALQYLLSTSDVDFQEMSGQPLAMGGDIESKSESGIKFQSRVSQGLTALAPLFFAERMTDIVLGRIIIERIQQHYTYPMVMRVTGQDYEYKDIEINGMDMNGNPINQLNSGRYDIYITNEDWSQSRQERTLNILTEVIKVAPPAMKELLIPKLVENAPIDNAKELADELRNVSQVVQMLQEQQQQMELAAQEQPAVAAGQMLPYGAGMIQ